MERLEACYFCGTAADAPLKEVTISPRTRQDDPDAAVRVTLCPSCEAKLERVLGGLFEHVESRRPSAEGADAPDGDEEPSEPVDRIDVSNDDAAGTSWRRGRRELFTEPPADDADEPTEEPADSEAQPEDAEIIEDEPRARARTTSGGPPSLDGVSVEEYNRVMRLLQNRSFPIERPAFVDLAASAYDLGEGAVEAVLDAVIEQGALEEVEGELQRPGGGEA